MKMTILHTNDIHSRFENFARISRKIKEIRDDKTLLLDAGDFNDFMRLELQGTNGKAGAELLSIAGYDAISIGNNEGFEGIEITETLAKSTNVPFLSCNLYKKSVKEGEGSLKLKSLGGVKRSIIVKKGGIRFLIIGTSPFGSYNEFYSLLNMHSTEPFEEIRSEIDKNKGAYDICILLSHCGMREDTEIAESVEGIDIIINGHSHMLMDEAVKINNTIIHMSGCYGEYLGKLEFEFDGQIKYYKAENLSIVETDMDDEIVKCIERNKEIATIRMSEPLYEIDRNLWHDTVEENPITNLVADALKDKLKCELSIINSGLLNGGVRKGPVSKKKLLEICPSPLNPTYMEIQGKYIKKAFEQSLDTDFCMQDGKGSGFRGKYLGKLHLSGGYVIYDKRSIKSIVIDGHELEEERWYSVATSDYLQRGTGYSSLANNKNVKYNPEYLRHTLEEYLQYNDYINTSLIDRWIKNSDSNYTYPGVSV